MPPILPNRKHPVHFPNRQRHNEPVILFLTVCTANRRAILASAAMHTLLVKAWALSRQWLVGRYIVMPDHVHLFCAPAVPEAENVKKWAAYWKGLVSRGCRGYGPLAVCGEGAVPPAPGFADGVAAVPPALGTSV